MCAWVTSDCKRAGQQFAGAACPWQQHPCQAGRQRPAPWRGAACCPPTRVSCGSAGCVAPRNSFCIPQPHLLHRVGQHQLHPVTGQLIDKIVCTRWLLVNFDKRLCTQPKHKGRGLASCCTAHQLRKMHTSGAGFSPASSAAAGRNHRAEADRHCLYSNCCDTVRVKAEGQRNAPRKCMALESMSVTGDRSMMTNLHI